MKHKKTNCVQFLEGGLPCEDCDLEGHPPACGWHRDWHSCDCGAFDKGEQQRFLLKVTDVIDQPDGSAIVQFDVDENFVIWFCHHKNITEFDKDIFQDWFVKILEGYIQEVEK